ncbi:TetR/AcrR family transcriptional regulator [Sulfitobacter aestuarii]|uniref:TetR/AcrR family transcriptional regulator n=1 Tax=Sulfitobacter aestuarii TaxID=2161676 RepID=A0ABW5U7K7_9RHOB
MQEKTGKIQRANTDTRRADLIAATLRVIARDGVRAATVRAIAKEADVTQGLIRYYFSTKDDLITAAYELHMATLVRAADEASKGKASARKRLSKFIQVSLQSPVTSHESIAIWAGFFAVLLHDPAMADSHKRSYDLLRLHLKGLIAAVLEEADIATDPRKLRRLSIAGNAILDGLWIEGGALPDVFGDNELVQVGLESFSALIGVELEGTSG